MFQLGAKYTRGQIHDAVGGDRQSYLPNREDRVVAACLKPKTDPDAPDVILPGTGRGIERAANLLVTNRTVVPTFVKRAPNQWEYVGEYVPARQSRDPADIAQHARRAGRTDVITSVIYMSRVGP